MLKLLQRVLLLVLVTGALVAGLYSNQAVQALDFPSACENQTGTVYDVGDGQTYTSIGAVPFDELEPGDLVRIHYRENPYHEKIAISTSGTESEPICLVGVAGPNGELPVIDGENATTSDNMFFDYDGMQERALLIIMGQEWGEQPAYIHIEGLHFKNAYEDYTFTTADGEERDYTDNAAAIMIQRGAHITLTGLTISDSGNGFFAASSEADQMVRDVTLEYSYIYGNGTDSDQHHNIYTEVDGIVIQFNHFAPLRSISGGNNIKDRSAGTVIRYNWIEDGAHLIDLVEAEDGYDVLSANPDYDKAWVYGNIMISPEDGGRNMLHFGGDLGGEEEGNSTVCGFGGGQDPTECYRKGPLYFYNNTVITHAFKEGDGSYCCSKTYFRLQTDEQHMEAFNNIFYVIGNEAWVSYLNKRGQAHFGVNLLKPSIDGHMAEFYDKEGDNSEITGLENLIVLADAENIGFVNENTGDYHLLETSPSVNHGQTITAPALPVPWEYLVHQGSIARIEDGAIDLGAYEQGDNPPQATNTPPPTATLEPTDDPALNLLNNSGFETDSDQDKQPEGWTPKLNLNDKIKCNKPGKIKAYEGNCAYQFKGGIGENTGLQQAIASDAITIGDVLTLSGFVNAKGTVDFGVKIRVKYTDPELEKGKITFKQTTPTSGYQSLSGALQLTVAGEVASFKVKLQNKGNSGKVLVDALALAKGGTNILPLPGIESGLTN